MACCPGPSCRWAPPSSPPLLTQPIRGPCISPGGFRSVRVGKHLHCQCLATSLIMTLLYESAGSRGERPSYTWQPGLSSPCLLSLLSSTPLCPSFISRLLRGPSLNSIRGPSYRNRSVPGVCREEVGSRSLWGSYGLCRIRLRVPAQHRTPICLSPAFNVFWAEVASLTPAKP